MKLTELKVQMVEFMPPPEKREQGILYISRRFRLSIHLCACGCGVSTVTPYNNEEKPKNLGWNHVLEHNQDSGIYTATLRPSIGNFMGESPYHAHYYITKNKIEWL